MHIKGKLYTIRVGRLKTEWIENLTIHTENKSTIKETANIRGNIRE